MPLYEYECQTEGNRFEVIQKFSDEPLTVCPTCGGPVKRLISSPAIQFKGSGWYITDYARKGGSNGSSTSSSSSSSTNSNGSSDNAKSSSSTSSSSDSSSSGSSSSTTPTKPSSSSSN